MNRFRFRENAVGVLSPGQGSQYPGMGEELYRTSDTTQQIFYYASESAGVDMAEVCFGSETDRLSETLVSQPAIAAVSLSEYYRLKELGFKPDAGIGHSMGEIPLLAMAGSLSIKKTFDILQVRAEATSKASQEKPGKMAAVTGLTLDEVKSKTAHILSGGRAAIANVNGLRQQVFSGDHDVIDELEDLIKEIRVRERAKVAFRGIRTGGAFHSRHHMQGAVGEFHEALESVRFTEPEFDIMLNNASYIGEVGISHLPGYLSSQLINGVDFVGGVQRLVDDGVKNFVEVGPGTDGSAKLKTLSKLIKRDFESRVRIIEVQEAG